MAYPLLRHRYSALSRISARIANSCGCNLGQVKRMSTLNSKRISPPWLLLPPEFEGGGGGDMSYRFYNLAEARIESLSKSESESELPGDESKLVGSSHGWLALFNPRNNHLFLSNPITGRHIKLPSIQTLPDPDLNFRGIVSKLVLTCSPDDQEDEEQEECRAFIIFGPADRLAFCHPRRRSSTASWTPLGNLFYKGEDGQRPRRYADLVYSSRRKLLFCVLKSTWVLECWDLREPNKLPRICWSRPTPCLDDDAGDLEVSSICPVGKADVKFHLFLVFQSDQLLLVLRRSARIRPDGSYPIPIYFSKYRGWGNHNYPYQTMAFDVHKVVGWDHNITNDVEGEVKLKCVYMKSSLDGVAMFLGTNNTFAISGDECPEMKLEPDCIYFTDTNKHPRPAGSLYGGHDIGIFQYINRTFSPCVYPREVEKIKRIVPAPMWFTPSPS